MFVELRSDPEALLKAICATFDAGERTDLFANCPEGCSGEGPDGEACGHYEAHVFLHEFDDHSVGIRGEQVTLDFAKRDDLLAWLVAHAPGFDIALDLLERSDSVWPAWWSWSKFWGRYDRLTRSDEEVYVVVRGEWCGSTDKAFMFGVFTEAQRANEVAAKAIGTIGGDGGTEVVSVALNSEVKHEIV